MVLSVLSVGAIAACTPQPTTEAPPEPEPTAQIPDETPEAASEEPPEAVPEPSAAPRSGSFVPGEHNTIGTAQLVEENGGAAITFSDDFQTIENAPDPVIVLHQSDDVIGSTEPPTFPLNEGEYVEIAPLQSPSGAQRYEIPAEIAPTQYQSVVIWCREFNATFAAASLQ